MKHEIKMEKFRKKPKNNYRSITGKVFNLNIIKKPNSVNITIQHSYKKTIFKRSVAILSILFFNFLCLFVEIIDIKLAIIICVICFVFVRNIWATITLGQLYLIMQQHSCNICSLQKT